MVEYLNLLPMSKCKKHNGNISSIFTSNSDAFASELPENLEDIFSLDQQMTA